MKKKLVGTLLLGAVLAAGPSVAMAETVTIDLGNPEVSVDANTVIMNNVAGVSKDGVILVPVRDVAKAFQGTVVYEEAQNLVKLTLPNGQWANIAIEPATQAAETGSGDAVTITSTGTFIDDTLYIPADLMATCLGAKLEFIDYGREEVFRLIYHIR